MGRLDDWELKEMPPSCLSGTHFMVRFIFEDNTPGTFVLPYLEFFGITALHQTAKNKSNCRLLVGAQIPDAYFNSVLQEEGVCWPQVEMWLHELYEHPRVLTSVFGPEP